MHSLASNSNPKKTEKFIPYMETAHNYFPEFNLTTIETSDDPVSGELYGCRNIKIVPGNYMEMIEEMKNFTYSNKGEYQLGDYGFVDLVFFEAFKERFIRSEDLGKAVNYETSPEGLKKIIDEKILDVCKSENYRKNGTDQLSYAQFRAYPFNKEINGKSRQTNNLDFRDIRTTNKEHTKFFFGKMCELLEILKKQKPHDIFEIVITDYNIQQCPGLEECIRAKSSETGLELIELKEKQRIILRYKPIEELKENRLLGKIGQEMKKLLPKLPLR